jgi:hypothetical protein
MAMMRRVERDRRIVAGIESITNQSAGNAGGHAAHSPSIIRGR